MKSTRVFLTLILAGISGLAACKDVLKVIEIASIQISGYSGPLEEGTSVQLTATPKDERGNTLVERTITWSTSNAGVATVSSSGLVIANNQGSASITASAEGKAGSVTVSVTVPAVAVVAITPGNASVEVGKTVQLVATLRDSRGLVLTGRVVTWTSSNPAIATVDPTGLVRGLAPGAVTIRATSEGVEGIAAVEVANVPVQSVTIDPPSGRVDVGYSLQLTATPRDFQGNPLSGRDIGWSSSNPAVAEVDGNGLVTGRGSGTAVIQAESEGRTATAAVTVIVPMAWVRANQPMEPFYVPQGTNLTGGGMTVTRLSTGRYVVQIEGLGRGESGTSFTAHVNTNSTAALANLTTPSGFCAVFGLNPDAPVRVTVHCVDPATSADADYTFRLLVVADRVLGGEGAPGQRAAFSFHSTSGTGTYTPSSAFAWNSANNNMTVTVNPSNTQTHQHGESLTEPYAVLTTRVGAPGGEVCPVFSYTGTSVEVACRDRSGTAVNKPHFLLALERGRPGTSWGYARVKGTDGSVEPRFSATSGSGINVTKFGVGKYTVVFEGTEAAAPPAIMLSTFSFWLNCTHFYTIASPVTIEVACSNASGAFVDDINHFWVAFLM